MKLSELLQDHSFREELRKLAPVSPYSGKPLTLTTNGHIGFTNWENSTDREWWEGADDCSYPKQIRQPLTTEQIEAAAIAAGFDADVVKLQCAAWTAEVEASRKDEAAREQERSERIENNKPEAMRIIIKRIEEKRAHDNKPNFGLKKQQRLEAALEGKPEALKLSDKFEIETVAGSI